MPHDPDRKHPKHGELYIEGQPTVIFDTVCTKHRKPWLSDPTIHETLCEVWREATAWLVGRYLLMPDHIHYFAWATEVGIGLDNWVKYWKSQFAKKLQQPQLKFQTDHWDTRMRCESHYEEKWIYVCDNPVRGKLVSTPEQWPFSGCDS